MELNLTFLSQYCVPVIVGICLCLGYALKRIRFLDDKWIPLLLMVTGALLNIWLHRGISPDILLPGMFSGLASTGVHQAFKQLIENGKKEAQ